MLSNRVVVVPRFWHDAAVERCMQQLSPVINPNNVFTYLLTRVRSSSIDGTDLAEIVLVLEMSADEADSLDRLVNLGRYVRRSSATAGRALLVAIPQRRHGPSVRTVRMMDVDHLDESASTHRVRRVGRQVDPGRGRSDPVGLVGRGLFGTLHEEDARKPVEEELADPAGHAVRPRRLVVPVEHDDRVRDAADVDDNGEEQVLGVERQTDTGRRQYIVH